MKYLHIYTMSMARQTAYRLNFVLGRAQSLALLLVLYYIWTGLSKVTNSFAGFTTSELVTYLLLIHVLRPVIFGSQSTLIAEEINYGDFSPYLLKPISHFWYCYCRELGERTVMFLTALIEVAVISIFIPVKFIWFNGPILPTVALLAVAHVFYWFMSYSISLIAFWTREAVGPRFLFNYIVEFTSGVYFPLRIVQGMFATLLAILPFRFLMSVPVLEYLGKPSDHNPLIVFGQEFGWLAAAAGLTYLLWYKGIRKYSAEGI